MSVAELRELEEVKGLITRGQRVGVLTNAEIAIATVELGLDEADVEELHSLFERCEIELVEEIDPAAAACLNIERAPEKRARSATSVTRIRATTAPPPPSSHSSEFVSVVIGRVPSAK